MVAATDYRGGLHLRLHKTVAKEKYVGIIKRHQRGTCHHENRQIVFVLSLSLSLSFFSALVLAALTMFSTHTYAESKEPDERFVGGVFDQRGRVTPEQLARSAEASKPVRPPAFFKEPDVDETGAASQILMLVDAAPNAGEISAMVASKSGCRTATLCERALLDIVNAQKDDALLSLLGRPTGARFLAEDYRLTDEERAQLKPDDAGLALQKTVVLRFATVKDARAALKYIELRREISQAALDQMMSYSTPWEWT